MIDDEDRENEGDLIFASELATPELVAFMVRYTSGYICVAVTEADADRLDLPPMHRVNQDRRGTAYTVTVDAREGVTTGISAVRPGDDDPDAGRRRTRPRATSPAPGTSSRCGPRTAACCAGPATPRPPSTSPCWRACGPSGTLCEIVSEKDPTGMARGEELRVFADEHDLVMVSIADLIAYRKRFDKLVERVAEALVPLTPGTSPPSATAAPTTSASTSPSSTATSATARTCWSGCTPSASPATSSARCAATAAPSCRPRSQAVADEGRGVVLYIRGHEGRGIGLLHKLQAYQLQDLGADTVDANLDLGLPADARDYGTGAQILVDLGVHTMRLLTNNPAKRAGLEGYGLKVLGRVSLPSHVTAENLGYLRTKRDRMGHLLDIIEPEPEVAGEPAHADPIPENVPLRVDEQPS